MGRTPRIIPHIDASLEDVVRAIVRPDEKKMPVKKKEEKKTEKKSAKKKRTN